jgi:hypothetical protein
MNTTSSSPVTVAREPWYKYGVAVLLIEMTIAIAVSAYSFYMTFHGPGGWEVLSRPAYKHRCNS